MLKPRPKISDMIDPAMCPNFSTVAERVAFVQQQFDKYEQTSAALGRPAACGPFQFAPFGFDGDGRKLGLRTTAEAAAAYQGGARRIVTIGECRRRGPGCCSNLGYAYFEYAASAKKHSQGFVQPVTTTGEVFSYAYEPFMRQEASEVECTNYNPMECSYHVTYTMEGKAGQRRLKRDAPHCYDPTEYLLPEQILMDFLQRYIATPSRCACHFG